MELKSKIKRQRQRKERTVHDVPFGTGKHRVKEKKDEKTIRKERARTTRVGHGGLWADECGGPGPHVAVVALALKVGHGGC